MNSGNDDRLGVAGKMDRSVTQPGGVLRLTIAPEEPPPGRRLIAVAVALDASLSMTQEAAPGAASKWVLAEKVVERVHALLPGECSMVLVRFSQQAQVVTAGPRPEQLPPVAGPSIHDPADRWTNVEDALAVAGAALLKHAPDADIYQILLVTDGEANFGVWQSDQLAQVVAELAKQGIGTDALGIGADARDEVLAEIVGLNGRTQHVWAAADDVERIDLIVTSLVEPVVEAVAGRGTMRVLVHPEWGVEAVRRLKPQRRGLAVPKATPKGTMLHLPLPAVGEGEDRPVFLLRLRAPGQDMAGHTVLQVLGEVVAGGRRLSLDSRVGGGARFKARVDGSTFPDADPFLEREEKMAEFEEDIALRAQYARSPAEVAELYRSGVARATQLGFDELVDAYNDALRALDRGVAAADAISGARVRATVTRTRTLDLVQPDTRADRPSSGRQAKRKRLDDVLGNG